MGRTLILYAARGSGGIGPRGNWQPPNYSSTFYLQNTPLELAVDLASWDPPFYQQLGGNLSVYIVDLDNDPSGFPSGPQEIAEENDALKVAQYLTDNPQVLANERLNPQTQSPMISTGWPGNDTADQQTTIEAWRTGSGVQDAIDAFTAAGYSQKAAANAIIKATAAPGHYDVAGYEPCIVLPSGQGSNYVLSLILRSEWADHWIDPVAFVNQQTGQVGPPVDPTSGTFVQNPVTGEVTTDIVPTPGTSFWAYHIGAGTLNLAIPTGPPVSLYLQQGVPLDWIYNVYFSGMGVAMLAGAGIQGGPQNTMQAKLANIPKFGAALDQYCQSASKEYSVQFQRTDLLSYIPVTPAEKAWLGASDLYNAFGIDAPTLLEAFFNVAMDGEVPPILPYTDPNALIVTWENKESQLGYNALFWKAVLQRFSSDVGTWLDTDAGKLYPGPKAETLQLIANAQY